MSKESLTMMVWVILLLLSIIIFSIIYVFIFKANIWKENIKKSQDLNLDQNIIDNIFSTNNQLRCYLYTNFKYMNILMWDIIVSFITIVCITFALSAWFGMSTNFKIISFTINAFIFVLMMIFGYLLQNLLNKQINKNICKNNNSISMTSITIVFPFSTHCKDNVKVQKFFKKIYYRSLWYISKFDEFYFVGKNSNYKDVDTKKIQSSNRLLSDIKDLSIYVAYISLINDYKIVNKLLTYKLINPKTQEQMEKKDLIECIVNNVYALSMKHIKRVKFYNLYSFKKMVNCFIKENNSN